MYTHDAMNIRNILVMLGLLSTLAAQGQAPIVNKISPTRGTVNERVIVRGQNFGTNAANIKVFFGGAIGAIDQINNNEIEVSVPAGATTSSISVVNINNRLIGYSSEVFHLSYDGFEFNRTNITIPPFAEATAGNDILYNFCVCDFNLDGYNDIVSTDTEKKASILQNQALGINTVDFAPPPTATVDAREARWVRCGDIDGDGKPDLVFTFSNSSGGGSKKNKVEIYRNTTTLVGANPNITFEDDNDALQFAIEGEQGGRMVIRDLDGDGKPELVVADLNGDGGVSVFRNTSTTGDIAFDASPVLPLEVAGIETPGVAGVDVVDLDRDGRPEIIASGGTRNLYVLANNSTPGNFAFALAATPSSNTIQNLRVADIDGDQAADIVVSGKNYLGVLRNITDDTGISFAAEMSFNASPNITYEGMDLADMDGDGRLDVLITNTESSPLISSWSVLLNRSTVGSLAFGSTIVQPTPQNRTVRGADFNGDGKPDIAYTSVADNTINIQLNGNCIQPVLEPFNGPGICDIPPYTLEATQGVGVTYQWESSTDGVTYTPVAGVTTYNYQPGDLPGEEKFYRVKVASSHIENCTARTSNAVHLKAPEGASPPGASPVLSDPNPPTYCFGTTVTIEAQAANAAFVWTNPQGDIIEGATTNVLTIENVSSAQAGLYEVYTQASEADGGCTSASSTVSISVSEPPELQIEANRPPVLFNGSSQVVLSVRELADVAYAWKRGDSMIPDATTASLTVAEAGSYTVVITNNNGCTRESAAFEVDNITPTISAEACLRQPNSFQAEPATLNGSPLRYRWSFGIGNPQEGSTVEHAYNQAGTFTVALELLDASSTVVETLEQDITVYDLPELEVTTEGNPNLCPGASVTLVGSEGFASYAWNTGETTASLTVAEAGTYSLTVTSDKGCVITRDVEVTEVPNPEAVITAEVERIGLGESVQLTASGGSQYRWSPGATLSDSTIANPVASPLVNTTYTCVVTTENGCSVAVEHIVYVDRTLAVNPRKIFSPNGDGQNDTWFIEKMELFPDCRLTLFNRQGVEVFKQENYSNQNPWSGTTDSEQAVPKGVYFYLIDCGDEAGQQTGSVTIVR